MRRGALAIWIVFLPGLAGAGLFEKRVAVAPGGALSVRLDRGAVHVVSHDAAEVRVEADARGFGASSVQFELVCTGDRVALRGDSAEWLRLLSSGPRVDVRIRVPRKFSVDVRTEGSVELRDVAGRVVARTRGGEIRVRHVEGSVELDSSGGPITIADARGHVTARSGGGPIRAHFRDEPSGVIDSRGGSITVAFPARARTVLDAEAGWGRIQVERAISLHGEVGPHRARGTINGGGDPLQLRAGGGNIYLRAH